MLVLSRKEAQRIRLGEDIVITVGRLGGDKVRLGIEAPKDMLVLRDELEPHDKDLLKQTQVARIEKTMAEETATEVEVATAGAAA